MGAEVGAGVGAGVVEVEDPAAIGVRLVPVHSVEDQPFAVDQQPVAGDLDRPKAEVAPDQVAAPAVPVDHLEREVVQRRGLR